MEQVSEQFACCRIVPGVPKIDPEMGRSWMPVPSLLFLVLF